MKLTIEEMSRMDCPACGSALLRNTDDEYPHTQLFRCSDEHRMDCKITWIAMNLEVEKDE